MADALEWAFLVLFPNYSLGQGLNDIYQNSVLTDLCKPWVNICPSPCCKGNCGLDCVVWTDNILSWEKPGIGRFVVFMAIQSAISFTMLLFIDYRVLSKLWYTIRGNRRVYNLPDSTIIPMTDNQISNIHHEDDDVIAEAQRLQSSSDRELMETDVLVLNQVEKVYHGMFHAVDQLSVGVKQSECFGLLGVNGA